MDINKALTAGSAFGLVLLNVSAVSVETSIAAAALVVVILLYLRGLRFSDFEIGIFILAELSPISLDASLPTALIYQGLSITLLLALCVPLNHPNGIAMYKRAVLVLLSVAAVPLVLLAITLYTGILRYSNNQLASLSTFALLALVCGIVVASQRDEGALRSLGL